MTTFTHFHFCGGAGGAAGRFRWRMGDLGRTLASSTDVWVRPVALAVTIE